MPVIFAADLDTLTLTTIATWKDRLITVEDRRNMTEARLQKLRDLTTQVHETPQGPSIDAGQLHDRLRDISPIPSVKSSSSNDSDAFVSNLPKDDLIAAQDAYNALLRMGGRPMRPLQYDNGLRDNDELRRLRLHPSEGARLRGELEKWRAFRDYQRAVRRDPNSFRRVQRYVIAYWQRRGLRQDLKPELFLDQKMQTKLDEWKEFYFHQHQRLEQKEKEVKEIQVQTSLKSLDTADGYCEDGLDAGDGWYTAAVVDLEAYASWLAWIEGQIPLISSECAVVAQQVSRTNPSYSTTRHKSSKPQQRSKTRIKKVRPPAKPKLGPRHGARVSKTYQSREPFKHPRPNYFHKTRSAINGQPCEDKRESVPTQVIGSIYRAEPGNKDLVYQQPLRRSARIVAQRQN